MPHPTTHRQLPAVRRGHAPAFKVQRRSAVGALGLVSGPVLFTLVQLGAIGLWSALMSAASPASWSRQAPRTTRAFSSTRSHIAERSPAAVRSVPPVANYSSISQRSK